MRICIFAMVCLFTATSPLGAETITSTPWRTLVVDGDTLLFPNHRVVLAGINALEPDQSCQNENGEDWACGAEATTKLVALMVDEVVCELHERIFLRSFGRPTYRATCFSGGLDVAKVLVREGLAVAEYADSERYLADERDARNENRGIWAGDFERPSDWREANPFRGNTTSQPQN